jgi:CarD family transcriptional regulator
MFNVDENIMYGNVGVCRIEGILGGDEIGMNTEKEYYKLYSYREKEIIYTPTDTNVFIRKIMTKEQIKELIRKIPSLKTIEIQSKNMKVQSDYYKTFLKNCDSENMLMLIKTIYEKNLDRKREGKKEGTIENIFFKEAQEKLHLEIAIAFGVNIEEVPKIIENELKNM